MGDDKRYNGWTNYETWVVNLWMDNDAGGQSYWAERAQEAYDGARADGSFTRDERATLDLADVLKAEHEESQPEVTGVWADLMGAALSEVNWYEIAEHFVQDCDKAAGATEATEESEQA